MELDEKGRCCGRKPNRYRGLGWLGPPGAPAGSHSPGRSYYLFPICKREYDMDGMQRENWVWKNAAGRYRRRKKEDERGYIIRRRVNG